MLENIERSTLDVNSGIIKQAKSRETGHKLKEKWKSNSKINSEHEHKPFVVPLLVFLLDYEADCAAIRW